MCIFTSKASQYRFDILVTCQNCDSRLEFGVRASDGHKARVRAREVSEQQGWMFYAQRNLCEKCRKSTCYHANGLYIALYKCGRLSYNNTLYIP